MQIAATLLLRFGNGLLGSLKTNLGMRAVAKRFLGRSAATAERHSFFDRKLVSVRIDQFNFALHDVRTIFDCLDCYLSHGRTVTEVDRVVLNAMSGTKGAVIFSIVFGEADPPGFLPCFNAT